METSTIQRAPKYRFTILLLFLSAVELLAVGLSSAAFYERARGWNLILGADIPQVSRFIIGLAHLIKVFRPLIYVSVAGLVLFEFLYKKPFTRIIVYTYIMLLLTIYFAMLFIAGFPPVWVR